MRASSSARWRSSRRMSASSASSASMARRAPLASRMPSTPFATPRWRPESSRCCSVAASSGGASAPRSGASSDREIKRARADRLGLGRRRGGGEVDEHDPQQGVRGDPGQREGGERPARRRRSEPCAQPGATNAPSGCADRRQPMQPMHGFHQRRPRIEARIAATTADAARAPQVRRAPAGQGEDEPHRRGARQVGEAEAAGARQPVGGSAAETRASRRRRSTPRRGARPPATCADDPGGAVGASRGWPAAPHANSPPRPARHRAGVQWKRRRKSR